MHNIDIEYGMYASKWGLSDFYEESKAKLMDALNSGEDFDTGWWGCKKEINYARICRENGRITVEVTAHMDDLYDGDDLIYDALWEECHTEEELPDDIITSITDEAIDCGINDCAEEQGTLPADASIDDIICKLDKLETDAMNANHEDYKQLRVIVREHYEYWKGEQTNGKDD